MKLKLLDVGKSGDGAFCPIEIDLPNPERFRSYIANSYIEKCIDANNDIIEMEDMQDDFYDFAEKHNNKICDKEEVLFWIKIFEAYLEDEVDGGGIRVNNYVDIWDFKDSNYKFTVTEFIISGGVFYDERYHYSYRIIYKEEIKDD